MYSKTVKLNHNEIVARINVETGELKKETRPNNLPNDKEILSGAFRKNFDGPLNYLQDTLKPLELKVLLKLMLMAKMNTNSLEPLNDKTTIPQLVEYFGVSKNKIKPALDKLFSLGVYGKFDVVKEDLNYTKYWVLNPYLSFQGRLVYSDIANLFKGTKIHSLHLEYKLKNQHY